MRPFEGGGEAALELHCSRNNCSLFALGTHQKKRPHNLLLGRLYDFRLYDMVEFGIRQYKSVQAFGGGAAQAQLGNKVRACTTLGGGEVHVGHSGSGLAVAAHKEWKVDAQPAVVGAHSSALVLGALHPSLSCSVSHIL